MSDLPAATPPPPTAQPTRDDVLVSSAGPGWQFAELIVEIAQFARRPSFTLPPLRGNIAGFVGRMVAIDIVIRIGVIWLTLLGTSILDATSILEEDPLDPVALFVLAVIAAPLIEETAWRLQLHPWSQWRFWVATLVWLAFGASALFSGEAVEWQMWMVVVWPVAFIVWRLTSSGERAARVWQQRQSAIIWICVFGFALAHVSNFTIPANDWRLAVVLLLVVPQLIGGLLITYTRVRAGYWAGVAHHAIGNAVLVVPAILAG